METLVVIPARYNSTRFPGKLLAELKGKPVLRWVCETCNALDKVKKILVATDHVEIYEAVKSWGYSSIMTSSDHNSGTDRVAEVAARFSDYQFVLNVQGDEPLVNPEHLNLLIDLMELNDHLDIGTLMTPIHTREELEDPNVVKVAHENNAAIYFSRAVIPYLRDRKVPDAEIPEIYRRHLGIYIFDNRMLKHITTLDQSVLEQFEKLEQLRWLANGNRIGIAEVETAGPGIDHPNDLKKAEEWLKKNQ